MITKPFKTLELVCEELLLEKDHRAAMVRFGIPNNVAEWLHQKSNKYSIWLADQIKDMQEYMDAKDKLRWLITNKQEEITEILDWISNTRNIKLKDYNWKQALETSKKWHESLKTNKLESAEKNDIIKTYPDGFYWVDMHTNRCSEEGAAMGHCGTDTRAETIFSLRKFDHKTGEIEAVVTISASPSKGAWNQAKGSRNSKPKDEYFPYIADLLVSKKLLVFMPTYNKHNDFNNKDLLQMVDESPNKMGLTDDEIEMIETKNIMALADKVFQEYNFEKLHVNYEADEENSYISADATGTITISDFFLAEKLRGWINEMNIQRNLNLDKKLRECISDTLQHWGLYMSENWYEDLQLREVPGSYKIDLFIELYKDSQSYYDTDELTNFDEFLNNECKPCDNLLKDLNFPERFSERLKTKLEDAGLIKSKEEEMSEEEQDRLVSIRRAEWDSRHGKLNFGESRDFSFKDYFHLTD